ncbi:MAG: PKD domain-containing protein [Deltaproteobacteria bacterium]|nr:PKD domain-containing protein [Deltaproteobacteria bacterium]
MRKALGLGRLGSFLLFLCGPSLMGCQGTVSDCTERWSVVCEDDTVFWVDSCGNRGEVRELCSCGCDALGTDCLADCEDLCEGVVCDDPQASICLDESTKRSWLSPGTCAEGLCIYESVDEVCEEGCQAGLCLGDPCTDVVCDRPPAPLCIDEGLMRVYAGAGQCEQGLCVYSSQDDTCSECCYGAEINPTGDPIGGGKGYREIFDAVGADWVVGDSLGLLAALDDAAYGDLIYVEDSAIVDLSGYDEIQVPAGVTLAGGRGRDGVEGALIWTGQFDTFPLFVAAGADVRFTGLRIMGPDPDVGDHDYQNPVLSRGIQTGFADLEVDNCEVFGFGHAAVVVYGEEATANVHHCHIHNNTRAGLGYGVVLNQSTCLIEANLFDSNRHSIAGTGRPGTSYEARYNLVLAHATGHYFDMHGAADFDKYISSAIWRFNEGSGDQALDSSVFNANHCSLVGMDTGLCWVPGQIETGLLFDGADDYLDCGNDSILQSATGSIEFWLRADRLDQDQELIELFEDTSANYLSVRLSASNNIGLWIEDNDLLLIDLESNTAISANALHHVALTQDGAGVRMYLDGQEIATSGNDGAAWSDHLSLAGLRIGSGHRSAFQGMLDELRFYSRALTSDEVMRHFLGQADIAGDLISIHHNTFRGSDMSAVVIRGVPAEPSSIHHNWFKDADLDHALRQTNALGNLDVSTNHLGPDVPLGTRLPLASGKATPDAGEAPLEVTFDAGNSHVEQDDAEVIGWRWDFGDGETAWGERVVHTYQQIGRYGVDLTVFDAKGATGHAFIPVEVSPAAGYLLSFWIKDSYRGPLSGYYVSQVLVDGSVVWEEDLTGDPGWRQVSVNLSAEISGQESTEIALRVLNQAAVLNTELIELSVYFDDVRLFGGDDTGGDFEGASPWAYQESLPDWSGSAHTEETRSGWRAFRIHHPYLRDCPQGSNARIVQTIPLRSEHLLADWRLDEGTGEQTLDRSLFGHHGQLVNMDDESWVAGVMGKALRFDGADDKVECEFSEALQSAQGHIVFWLSAEPGSTGSMLSLYADEQNHFTVELDAEGCIRLHQVDAGVANLDLQSTVAVDDGLFHHIALVQDGSGVRIYVDGLQGESGQNGPNWTDGLTLTEVSLGDGPLGFYAGVLDEVHIDDRPVDASWIEEQVGRGRPLGLWHFDEGQGETAHDAVGGHDGSLLGMNPALNWVEGITASAVWFDGSDDYLDFADAAGLGSTQGTVEFWFRSESFDENQDLLNLFEDGFQNYLLIRRNDRNRITVRIEDNDVGIVNLTAEDLPITDTAFHHLAVTQDGFGLRIYIDGHEQRCTGDNSGAWTDHLTLTGMWLGRGHWSWFKGTLDELALHARALRPKEIAERALVD